MLFHIADSFAYTAKITTYSRELTYSDRVSNIILQLDENVHTAHSGILLGVLGVGFPMEKEGPIDSLSAKLSITEPGENERIDWYSIGETVWIGDESWEVAKVTAPERDASLDGSGVDTGPMVTLHRTA